MCHVLIIEDEVLFAIELSLILGGAGATSFDVAETADEAIYAASIRPPDIITSDVKLRKGGGIQAVNAIQVALGPTPVIFITASPETCGHLPWPARVLGKPLHEAIIARVFREMAPSIERSPSHGFSGVPAVVGSAPMLSL